MIMRGMETVLADSDISQEAHGHRALLSAPALLSSVQSRLCGDLTVVNGIDGFHKVLVDGKEDGEHLYANSIWYHMQSTLQKRAFLLRYAEIGIMYIRHR